MAVKARFVKYFRQRLLSLVNIGLHAAIIRLSPLIHGGEKRYKASVTPPLKNPGYAPALSMELAKTQCYEFEGFENNFLPTSTQ